MAFENAKRLLQNKHARLSTTTEGIYDDNLIVLFWADEVFNPNQPDTISLEV